MTQQTTDPRIAPALDYIRHQASKGLADLAALMERTAADWQRCLEGMTDSQAAFKPTVPTGPAGEDEWTPKQIVGHLLVTERGLNTQIAEMAGVTPPPHGDRIRQMGVISEDEEARPLEELRGRIADVFEESRQLALSLEEGEKLAQRFPHPVFGPLNLKEWFAFHRVHAMDHIQQIDKIKADPAYPGS